MHDRLSTALEVAESAFQILTSHFGSRTLQISSKLDESLVTNADLEADAFIRGELKARLPEDQILSEEDVSSHVLELNERFTWVIDPLDGTSNFAFGFRHYGVSIGLYRGPFEPVLGVVRTPYGMYAAVSGSGVASKDGVPMTRKAYVPNLERAAIATGIYVKKGEIFESETNWQKELARRCAAIRRLGASVVDICLLSEGVFDLYLQYGVKAWDVAAASIIAREMGMVVRNYEGQRFDIFTPSVIIGSASIVEEAFALRDTWLK